jgi:hypothetical protein
VTNRLQFVRQMLVAEVGEAGQARLEAATFALAGDGLAHQIAQAYAARAGVGSVVQGPIDEGALVPSFVENAAARSVVAGSRAALAAMRAILLPLPDDAARP